jgi:hypothetical protein
MLQRMFGESSAFLPWGVRGRIPAVLLAERF